MRARDLGLLFFVVCKVRKEFKIFSAYFCFSEMDRGFLTSPSPSYDYMAFILHQTLIETS